MAGRGMPSMMALLGLLAVAGYQNRDKLGQMLGQAGGSGNGRSGDWGNSGGSLGNSGGFGSSGPMGSSGSGQGGLGGMLGGLGGLLGGGSAGGILSGGLGELVDRFRQNGHEQTAQSWVGTGPNQTLAPDQLEQALGHDTLSDLERHTGLSRPELLARLSRELPKAVDGLTPDGRIPSEDEVSQYIRPSAA